MTSYRRDDDPVVWDPVTGEAVSPALSEEIKQITGNPNATLTSVMNDPDLIWRREALHQIRRAADR